MHVLHLIYTCPHGIMPPFTGNFQVKMLSEGCHRFDLSFLLILPHLVVGVERGAGGYSLV